MPDEPDRYDLDEMMDRLKQRADRESNEEGEMVTREDGSQAVRVRRRRRRSHQPHKERQRRFQVIQIVAALVVLLLVVIAVGFVTVYVNTTPYRNQVTRKLSVSSGADVELQQFRMNPTGVNAHGVDFDWPEGNLLDSLSVRMVRADVWPVAVLTGRLSGQELTAQTAKLTLQRPALDGDRRVVPAISGKAPVYFRQCSIKDFQIEMKGQQAEMLRLTGSEAAFMPGHEEEAALLRMSGGDIRARGWPFLRLNRAYIEFESDQAKIVGLSILHADDERGKLEISGILKPYQSEDPSMLSVKASSFLFSGLVGDGLGEVFDGSVDSSADPEACKLVVRFGDQAGLELDMVYLGSAGESFAVQNLPFLYALAQAVGDEWYAKPNFWDVVSGRLVRGGDRVELSEMEFNRKDRMAIRGHLNHEAGVLSGRLEVGVAFHVLQAAENQALESMFSKPREGFRWIEIEVSGTSTSPVDNFGKIYNQALSEIGGKPLDKPQSTEASTFEELTRPR